jgi:uncharacterized RDD family membrane protein YckC
MSWYYQDGNQQVGPVSKAELQELIKAKRINGRTQVRNVTMAQWRTLADIVHAGDDKLSSPSAAEVPSPKAPVESSLSQHIAVCSQCGRTFPKDQVLAFDDQVICAACKPMFVQRLKEGATLSGSLKFAGFWVRFAAKIIDSLILIVLQYAVLIPIGVAAFSSLENDSGAMILMVVTQLITFLIPMAYTTFFVGRFAATPGKMACRIKVVAPDGDRISYMRGWGRYFAEILSALILLIGYLMAAFDSDKRALHDRICSTRVVYK